ncbi:MAG TPA: hypothetical protein VGB82_04635 [Alphaproteobacteria bacterium]
MLKAMAVGLCAAALLVAGSVSASAETYKGTVARLTVTLKFPNGKTRLFEVRDDVNLNDVDEGDEVQITVEKGEIVAIKVTKEDPDPPKK